MNHRLVKNQKSGFTGALENNLTCSEPRGASDRNYFWSSAPPLRNYIPDFSRPAFFLSEVRKFLH